MFTITQEIKTGEITFSPEFIKHPSCCSLTNGFYFTDKDNLYKLFGRGTYIQEVFEPNDPLKSVIQDVWRTNKLTFGNVINPFGILIKEHILFWACCCNNVDILKNLDIKNSAIIKEAIFYAATNNSIDVLNWFVEKRFSINYDIALIHEICEKGYIEVLEWFNNYTELKYDVGVIDRADKGGQKHIMKWFYDNGFMFKIYTTDLKLIYDSWSNQYYFVNA